MPDPENPTDVEETPEEEVGESTDEVDEATTQPAAPAATAPAPANQPAAPAKKADELKVVINKNGDNILIGVGSPDCDPVFTVLKGDLAAALARVPAAVEEAKQKWAVSPRYPKANLPEPPPSPTPARTPAAPKAEKKTAQPSFF